MPKHSAPRSAPPRPQHPVDSDPGALHDDALIGSSKAARFLGLPESTFFLIRKKMGRDFPRPVITCGRPRYRVGTLREWLRRMESENGGNAA
jgi:predicted DNA-binding transcriptional regulator AlpA